MFLFGIGNKKKKKDIVVTEERVIYPSDIYIKNINEYVEYYGKEAGVENPLDNKEFYKKLAVPYYNTAMKIINFINDRYPDEMFDNDEVVEFDYKGLMEHLNDNEKSLLLEPSYPNLVYINDAKYYTHFHIENGIVVESEGIESLPGLSRPLANEKINKLFCGLDLIDVRNLLSQMNILPKDNELDNVIRKHNEVAYLHKKFIESALCLLLVLKKNKHTISKARFLADSFGVNFDFSIFEPKEVVQKKLVV